MYATLLCHLSAQCCVRYCCFSFLLFGVNNKFSPSPEQQVGCTCCQEITESGSSKRHSESPSGQTQQILSFQPGGYEINILAILAANHVAGSLISCERLGFNISTISNTNKCKKVDLNNFTRGLSFGCASESYWLQLVNLKL